MNVNMNQSQTHRNTQNQSQFQGPGPVKIKLPTPATLVRNMVPVVPRNLPMGHQAMQPMQVKQEVVNNGRKFLVGADILRFRDKATRHALFKGY